MEEDDGTEEDGTEEDDPFRELRLDEEFVRGASAKELAAADRARRAEQIAARKAAEEAKLRAEKLEQRADKRLKRKAAEGAKRVRSPRILPFLIVIGIAVAWTVLTSRGGGDSGLQPPQPEDAEEARQDAAWQSGTASATRIPVGDPRPTPRPATSTVRIATQPVAPAESGPYRFLLTQPNSAAPVTYDPCRVVPVVVNRAKMPAGGDAILSGALAELRRRAGLSFQVEGASDEAPTTPRKSFQPERYGDRWAPVLIAWTDPAGAPVLAGDVGGAGWSNAVDAASGRVVYVTGQVYLDGPAVGEMLKARDGTAQAQALLLHELAHVVGLDHVDDDSQLMHPIGTRGLTGFATGDLQGLAMLGAGPCIPSL